MPARTDLEDATDVQDGAEALDETNLDGREETAEMRTFEELPDVLDLTSAPEDDDEDGLMADNDSPPGPDDVEGPIRVHAGETDDDVDARLDEGLEESFPASDPPSMTRRED